MKIGIFSDPHYCKADDLGLNRRPIFSLAKIKETMEEFKKIGVEICFCLGDLVDRTKEDTKKEVLDNLKATLEIIHSYGIPFYLAPGNHDFVDLTREDFKALGVQFSSDSNSHILTIESKEYNFIILDTNVRSNGEHFDTAGHVWDDANLPKADVEAVSQILKSNQGKKYIVLVHENLDPTVQEQHIIKNAEEIRGVIKESGNVKMVIQGHFHEGSEWYDEDICYHTVKAMCLGEKNHFEIIII